jgi:hypothetical protein
METLSHTPTTTLLVWKHVALWCGLSSAVALTVGFVLGRDSVDWQAPAEGAEPVPLRPLVWPERRLPVPSEDETTKLLMEAQVPPPTQPTSAWPPVRTAE